ncbi:glutamine synthetase [Streptomyces bauhiniae]|uniref:glutamine synthetase n=1 Tax=Streptomyces bauhiniae TaxID=2340725 RepID=UPI00362C81F8
MKRDDREESRATASGMGAGTSTRPGAVTSGAGDPAAVLAAARTVSVVHVLYGDPHGIARSKALSPGAFADALEDGVDFSPGPLVFDTGHAIAVSIDDTAFVSELRGAGDMVVVPDLGTWTVTESGGRRVGWVIGDERLRGGDPHPLSSRRVLRETVRRAARHGWTPVIGIELEFYLLRRLHEHYAGTPGGFGVQGLPEPVAVIDGGYQFNSTRLLEAALDLLTPLWGPLEALGARLRTVEHESGPGQLEITFAPQDALAAADTVLMLRTWLKCFTRPHGLHVSFMGLPAVDRGDPSGWHLHQSGLRADGTPWFAGGADGELGPEGRSYVAGLVRRAADFALLSNGTVNAYHRFAPEHALSPTRLGWAREDRGALIRVADGGAPHSAHAENRVGDPTANPYLYIAAQVSSGVEGVVDALPLGPESRRPQQEGESLPRDLGEAVERFESSKAARELVGHDLHRALVELKRSEWNRFTEAAGEFHHGRVSEWEACEYSDEY